MDSIKEKVQVSVATYNLQSQSEKEALVEIFDKILKFSPDVIAVQGMTKMNSDIVFRILKSSGYNFSRFDQVGSKPRPVFEILFSKIPVLKKEYIPFNRTTQNKGLSKYLVTAGSRTQNPINVNIFTSHLESDSSGNTIRKNQITEIISEHNKNPDIQTIFAGDTSIPSWQEMLVKCPNEWGDAWRVKGTSQNEKTSFYDRSDQVWLSPGVLEIADYSKIKIGSEDTRAGVYVAFSTRE